jgi:methionyl-tRNA formyltransferase
MLRLLAYRALVRHGADADRGITDNEFGPGLRVVRVPTANSEACIAALRESRCDVVCLMGTRILTRRTLEGIACPTINIHSSDPRFVRGGPVVVWEVLAQMESITLTIHNVAVEVDSGAILLQKQAPILFSGGLGATTHATMANAEPIVADLFERVLLDLSTGRAAESAFTPGPLRVTPPVPDLLRAESMCRARSRRDGSPGA